MYCDSYVAFIQFLEQHNIHPRWFQMRNHEMRDVPEEREQLIPDQ